jgi:hypothetical protein
MTPGYTMEQAKLSDESDFKAVLDATSVAIKDDRVTANIHVSGRFHKQYVFGVTWKKGHEADWSWQGTESWLQTEFNAEQLGVEPAQLLASAEAAILDFAADRATQNA